ncbi:coiled-coil domain-containing protein [Saccharicrinis fermentans]|uniref:Uncharacterized protein n=1 Tax=Saccharicrinis fermentans DSM 9555 = JCM 21142 TaxID=869213 RepID=W7YQK2_9BACT|nr:hypothetical protein [Saccharicrinis fermentans]GAF04699.1 hypothetical protein JCM21142_93415 [Saccharicrinis fermentans DSM 9555 = JCM 21142]
MRLKKRNLVSFASAALALSLTFTGCIDNEESDGVYAMRQAQAALINAKAEAETILATAQAAYDNARAQVELAEAKVIEAEADYQVLQNEAKQLENSIQAERDAAEIAILEAQLEVTLAEQKKALADAENAIELAALVNEQVLAEAQQDLAEALQDLKDRVAAEEIENSVLETYVDRYDVLTVEITNLQEEIVGLTAEIALDKLYAIGGDSEKLIDELAKVIAEKNADKADQEALQARYEAVLTDLSSIDAEIVSAKDEVAALEASIVETDVLLEDEEDKVRLAAQNMSDARLAYDGQYYVINVNGTIGALTTKSGYEMDAEYLMDEAFDAYNYASDLKDVVDDFEGNDPVEHEVDAELFTTYDYELEESHMVAANARLKAEGGSTSYLFREIDFYEDIVSSTSDADDKEDAQLIIDFLKLVVTGYEEEIGGTTTEAGVEALRNAYFAAKDVYIAKELAFDNASDAYDAAVEAKAVIEATKAEAQADIDNLEDYITTIQDGNKEMIEEAISDAKEAIISIEEALAVLDINSTQWTGLIAVKELELSQKEEKLAVKQQEADSVKALIDAELAK